MRQGVLLAVLLATATLAGCLGDGPGSEGTDPAPDSAPNATDDGAAVEPSAAGTRDTSEPVPSPEWQVGDWWRYRVEHALGPTTNVTLVVTQASTSSYQLGWTEPTPGLPSLLYHMPPAGEISRPELGWWWHGETVHLVEFPLEDGKTWQASLPGSELTFTAERVTGNTSGPTFEIDGVDANGTTLVQATYDVEIGFFTDMARVFGPDGGPSPGVTLTGHGTLADLPGNGTVHVPVMRDLVDEGILGPDPAAPGPPTGTPAGSFQVEEGTSRLALGAFLGGAEGVYEATWRPPSGGPELMFDTVPPGETSVSLFTAFPEDPAGTWGYQALPGGPGFIFLEAVAVTLEPVDVTAGTSGPS